MVHAFGVTLFVNESPEIQSNLTKSVLNESLDANDVLERVQVAVVQF